jgi:pyruvate dehydrogenase E1 component alpha subunit
LNLAAVFDLPIVFVCENNLYGVGTRQTAVRRVEDIADRASGYGMPGEVVDGNDVMAVYEAAVRAVERARGGEGPTLLECKTYRWRTLRGRTGHLSPPEKAAWLRREPIAPFREMLISRRRLSQDEVRRVEEVVSAELDQAVAFARESPFPEPEAALTDLWA